MAFFSNFSLAYQFVFILGGLIILTFAAALVRLYLKKRQVTKNRMRQDIEAAERATQKAMMSQQVPGEGDLFGVRAIENGFYGGVAQSPSNSTVNSPRLVPVTVVDEDGMSIPSIVSTRSSTREISPTQSKSPASSPGGHASTMSLRLQPSEAELNRRRNHDSSTTVNTYVPTSAFRLEHLTKQQPNSGSSSTTLQPRDMASASHVQSYAQWHFSNYKGTARSISRSEYHGSDATSQKVPIVSCNLSPDHYIGIRTGLSESCSVSSAEIESHLLVQQHQSRNQIGLDFSKHSIDMRSGLESDYFYETREEKDLAQPSIPHRTGYLEVTARSTRRHSNSETSNVGPYRQPSTTSARSLRRARDSLEGLRKSCAGSMLTRKGPSQGWNIDLEMPRNNLLEDFGESYEYNSFASASSDSRSRSGSGSSKESVASAAPNSDGIYHDAKILSRGACPWYTGPDLNGGFSEHFPLGKSSGKSPLIDIDFRKFRSSNSTI